MKQTLISRWRGLTGNVPELIVSLLMDVCQALVLKVKWQIVVERFVSRAITIGLRWLENRYSNQLLKVTVDTILEQLGRADVGLPKIKEQDARIQRKAASQANDAS